MMMMVVVVVDLIFFSTLHLLLITRSGHIGLVSS